MQRNYWRYLLLALCPALLGTGSAMADKPAAQAQKLPRSTPMSISAGPAMTSFRTADTCDVYIAGPAAYYIYPWVVGDEIYKAYQDPAQACDNPYPFTIDVVQVPLVYLQSGVIYLGVDIEEADRTTPGCPRPGAMLAITPLYEVALENDFYLITIPLDTPVVVNAPYFVGVYIGPEGVPSSAAVVTDTIPLPCVGYNDWGEGYVDLDTVHNIETGEKIFPGRLIMYSSGTVGGSGGLPPAPSAQFIAPESGQLLGATVDLWANDAAGSDIIERADFEVYRNNTWTNIGSDALDDPVLRNGVTASGAGNGLSLAWNTTGLTEGDYQLRVLLTDTLGRKDTTVVPVRIDPTPPFPAIQQPSLGQNVCGNLLVRVVCPDENLSFVSFEKKAVTKELSLPITIINQRLGGDMNNNPNDGNPASNGEFGDYCAGPASAAMAVKYWYGKGYSGILTEGTSVLSDVQLMARLFSAMNVEDNMGTLDEEFVAGLRGYILSHGSQFQLYVDRGPTMNRLLSWLGDLEYAVMVGVSGTPGFWLCAAGYNGLIGTDGCFTFRMANPLTGAAALYKVKDEGGKAWLMYGSTWKEIDLIVGLVPNDWSVARSAVGIDAYGSDGWGFYWETNQLSADSLYFLDATAVDATANVGTSSVLVQNSCTVSLPGDVNNDGAVNAVDVVFLSNFLYMGGPQPPAGILVADINCDDLIGLQDLIYLYKHLFLRGPAPCP
jgi:hypothetical protein